MRTHPTIQTLLPRSGPAHVARNVAVIILDAVQRVLGAWRVTYMGVERLKRIDPFRVNSDASVQVIAFPFSSRWIEAPLLHVLPCHVDLRLGHGMGTRPLRGNLAMQAAAASGFSFSKLASVAGYLFAAVAFTQPFHSSQVSIFGTLFHQESSETLASQIYEGGHS